MRSGLGGRNCSRSMICRVSRRSAPRRIQPKVESSWKSQRHERNVLANWPLQREAFGNAIGGEVANPAAQAQRRRNPVAWLAIHLNASASERLEAIDRADQLGLAATDQTRNPRDLPGVGVKINVGNNAPSA